MNISHHRLTTGSGGDGEVADLLSDGAASLMPEEIGVGEGGPHLRVEAAGGRVDPLVEVLVLAADPSQMGLDEALVRSDGQFPFSRFNLVRARQAGAMAGVHTTGYG